MVKQRERVIRRQVTSDHIVQFFDAADTLGPAVAQFLHEGRVEGASALIVARPSSTQAIARALEARGMSVDRLVESGALTVLDAETALQAFMHETRPDRARFDAALGSLVRRLAGASSASLRIYGEMVELLASEGNFAGAEAVEDLWNALGQTESFMLLCGYSAAHFTGQGGCKALRAVCGKHRRVHQDNADLLASWLLNNADVTPLTSVPSGH